MIENVGYFNWQAGLDEGMSRVSQITGWLPREVGQLLDEWRKAAVTSRMAASYTRERE